MLRGTETVEIGGVEHAVGENEIFIVPAQTVHKGGQPSEGDHLFLAITSPPRTDLGDTEAGVPTYLEIEARDD
jgi:mannose-6-phosphate isomerase-like protein (cupin superfamily)